MLLWPSLNRTQDPLTSERDGPSGSGVAQWLDRLRVM